jgi:hypothetical protein
MRAFFRSVFVAEPGVDAALADRLAEACAKRINRMLVWDATGADSPPETTSAAGPAAPAPPPAGMDGSDRDAGLTPAAPPKPSFDPFAFSVVVVLKRKGRAALAEALKAITSSSDLRKLADAQHLGVDPAIKDAKSLREAIIKGAEQRMADRKAAAS